MGEKLTQNQVDKYLGFFCDDCLTIYLRLVFEYLLGFHETLVSLDSSVVWRLCPLFPFLSGPRAFIWSFHDPSSSQVALCLLLLGFWALE